MNTPKCSQGKAGKSGIAVADGTESARSKMAEQIAQAEMAWEFCQSQAAAQGAEIPPPHAFVLGFLAGWMERDEAARQALVTVN